MESENFHHQEDHQLLVDSSCHALSWYQNSILNGTRNNTNLIRDVKQNIYQNIDLIPMSQDSRSPSISMENFETHDELQHLARIKHELSGTRSYSELPQIISSSSPTSSIEDFMSKNNNIQRIRYNNNNYITNQDILLKTFSNGCQIKNDQLMNQIPSSDQESISYPNIYSNSYYRGTFSQIFPTLNVSNLNQPSTCDIYLPALDQFGSPTSNGSFSYQPSSLNAHNLEGFCKDNYLSYGVDHQMNNKTAAAFIRGSTEAKRSASNYMDVKASKATPTKKSKLDLRPSCSPLKIRKEKLGDRISTLQQMVAPFGKTDTASVLMEAIGYIKFLQNQVETLSVPYMNSTQKTSRISTRGGSIKNGDEETKRDLRSRGLCLVPVSCLTYICHLCRWKHLGNPVANAHYDQDQSISIRLNQE